MNFFTELAEIEKRLLEEGDTPEIRKQFWRIVGKVKRLPPDQVDNLLFHKIAEIRNVLFKKKIILSYKKGAILFFLGLISTYLLFIWYAFNLLFSGLYNLVILVLLDFVVLYFSFLTGRCIASKLTGIKFEGFYQYDPLEFGMKLDYVSYLKAGQGKRVVLFAIPLIWEIVILISQTLTLWFYSIQGYEIPAFFILLMAISQYAIHKTAKTGEFHRFLREFKIYREIRKSK